MNVMIVDDHQIVRDGLAMILEQAYFIDHVKFASDGFEAIKCAGEFPADLVLLDMSMPGGMDGLSALGKVRKHLPEAKIVIFSMFEDISYQKRAFELGADGYLVKQLNRDEMIESLDRIIANQRVFDSVIFKEGESSVSVDAFELPISKREKEVFGLTVNGFTLKDIAEKLEISVKTVENHRQKIGEKLGTHKRHEWIELAKKHLLL